MLSLRAGVVDITVESEKLRYDVITHTIEEAEFPSQGGSRKAQGPQRMTDVVLAVPERTLAILRGLSPMNGREPDEE